MLAPNPAPDSDAALQRAEGRAHVAFRVTGGTTRLADLYQSGCAKIRLPRTFGVREAVVLNTAGGIAGGDRIDVSAAWGPQAQAVVATQTAERVYRSLGAPGRVANRLRVETGAEACWLPQETIVFDGAALERTLEADVAPGASLLAVESVVLGRAAMGETVTRLRLRDRWRLRRGGRLVFADDTRLVGDPQQILAGPACGAGARAYATLVAVGDGVETRLEEARAILAAGATPALECGASAWNGVLVVRMIAGEGQALRGALMNFLRAWRGTDLPRVWLC